jgi:hypothetical protein
VWGKIIKEVDMKIDLSDGLTERGALLYVKSEEGNMHIAWKILNGTILVFEHCPSNYPSIDLVTFPNIKVYKQAIMNVSWICHEYIIKCNDNDILKLLEDKEE